MANTQNKDKLYVGQKLNHGEELRSQNGRYHAIMQADGNFVVYTGTIPMWASDTYGTGSKFIILQEDGNLVTYTEKSEPRWASDTGKRAWYLVMQNDGNLVLYGPDGRKDGSLWASNTNREMDQLRVKYEEELRHGEALVSRNGRFQAIMQHDGNFVVYDAGKPIWATDTGGSGADQLIMQGDGNIVLHVGNKSCWASNTDGLKAGMKATHLIMQDDGNLVLYDPFRHVRWATDTSMYRRSGWFPAP